MIIKVMRLKENLKHYLALKEISAAQLSRKCKSDAGISVPKATISNWLAGGSVRRMDSLYAVSRVLGVSVDELLFGQPEQKKVKSKDKNSIIDMLIDGKDGWLSGRFEIRLRKLRDEE